MWAPLSLIRSFEKDYLCCFTVGAALPFIYFWYLLLQDVQIHPRGKRVESNHWIYAGITKRWFLCLFDCRVGDKNPIKPIFSTSHNEAAFSHTLLYVAVLLQPTTITIFLTAFRLTPTHIQMHRIINTFTEINNNVFTLKIKTNGKNKKKTY